VTVYVRRLLWLGAIPALAGCALGGAPRQLSASGAGAFEVSLAASEGRIVAAWYDTRDGNPEIYMRDLDADADRRLTMTAAESFVPDVAWLDADVIIAWLEKSAETGESALLGRWTATGSAIWQRRLGRDGANNRNPIVLTDGVQLFTAWIEFDETEHGRVMGQWLDPGGNPLTIALPLGEASADTWNLNGIVVASSHVLLVFDSAVATRASELYLVEVDGTRVATRRLTADDGFESKYPDVAATPTGLLLSWQDARDGNTEVYVAADTLENMTLPIDARATRITSSPGQSIGAYLATNGARAAIVWCDDSDGDFDVFLQPLSMRGAAAGRLQRLHRARSDALIPAIVAVRDGFGVAWNEIAADSAGLHTAATRSEILYRTVR